jgi:hypothetical protein
MKTRRIEIIYNLIFYLIKKKNFEANKIYNIDNEKNIEILILNNLKKRRFKKF